jgi:hypothetical protein
MFYESFWLAGKMVKPFPCPFFVFALLCNKYTIAINRPPISFLPSKRGYGIGATSSLATE